MHRVAITGIGVVSTLGTGVDAVSVSLREGRSGIIRDEEREKRGFQSPLTGAIRDFSTPKNLSRKQRKTMPDFGIWAYAATEEALTMAGLESGDIQNGQTGLIFGSDSSCIAAIEQVQGLEQCGDTSRLGSGLVFRAMTSTVTMNLNVILGTQGACWTLSSACSSGGHAVGQAADLIALGRQERVICGGVQEINWESTCSFDGLGAFSQRVDAPAEASRPFDAARDGLVPSGGAAALILERYDLAEARGATILGEVAGYGFSSDGGHISVPSETGLSAAMRMALSNAGRKPEDVEYICAHATSTPRGDSAEAENIVSVFGEDGPLISSTKSMTGHELWMSGAAQAVYSVIMNREGFIAPNINLREPDEASSRLNLVRETLDERPKVIMCNSMGFGGTNSCLLLSFDSPES